MSSSRQRSRRAGGRAVGLGVGLGVGFLTGLLLGYGRDGGAGAWADRAVVAEPPGQFDEAGGGRGEVGQQAQPAEILPVDLVGDDAYLSGVDVLVVGDVQEAVADPDGVGPGEGGVGEGGRGGGGSGEGGAVAEQALDVLAEALVEHPQDDADGGVVALGAERGVDVLLVGALDERDGACALDPDGAQGLFGDAAVLDDGRDAGYLLDPRGVVPGAVGHQGDDRDVVVLDEFQDEPVGQCVAAAHDVVVSELLDRRGPQPFMSHIVRSY